MNKLVALAAVVLLLAVAATAFQSPVEHKVNKQLLHKLVEKIRSGEIEVKKIRESEDELKHMIQRIELKKRSAGAEEKQKLDEEELGVAAKLAALLRQKKKSGGESSESGSESEASESAESAESAESGEHEGSEESGSKQVAVNAEPGTGFTIRDLEHELAVLADLQRHATGQTLEELRVEQELVLNRIRRLKGENAPVPPQEEIETPPSDHINHNLDPLIAHLITLRLSENGLSGMMPEDVRNLEIHVRALLAEIEKHFGEPIDAIPNVESSESSVVEKCETEPCGGVTSHKVEAVAITKRACEETNSCSSGVAEAVVVTKRACEATNSCAGESLVVASTTPCAPNTHCVETVQPQIVEKNSCHETNSCGAVVASVKSSCDKCVVALETCKKTCTVTVCAVNFCELQHDSCHSTCPGEVIASTTRSVSADVVTSHHNHHNKESCVSGTSCISPQIVADLK